MIRITEKDYTGNSTVESSTNIVYIPVIGSEVFCKVFSTVTEFTKKFGSSYSNKSLVLAYKLIKLGLPVLIDSYIAASEVNVGKLKDKGLYDVRFLTDGGLNKVSELIEVANLRQDCVALIDTDKKEVAEVRAFYEGLGLTEEKGKYCAGFVPGVIVETDVYESESGVKQDEIHITGGDAFLLAYGKAIADNPSWFAFAGTQRGIIPNLVAVDKKEYGDYDCASLQNQDLDGFVDKLGIAINPICNVDPYGVVCYGARTLFNNVKEDPDESGATILTASSFLNIRNACNEIKKCIYKAAKKFKFEQNTDVLWFNFESEITPLLDEMQNRQGIAGYKLTKVKVADKKGRLACNLRIVPIEPVESFDITIELADSLEVNE